MSVASDREITRLRNAHDREVGRLRVINAELLTQLKRMTLLARGALLCTSAEIAREAKPMLAAADAAIAKAEVSP